MTTADPVGPWAQFPADSRLRQNPHRRWWLVIIGAMIVGSHTSCLWANETNGDLGGVLASNAIRVLESAPGSVAPEVPDGETLEQLKRTGWERSRHRQSNWQTQGNAIPDSPTDIPRPRLAEFAAEVKAEKAKRWLDTPLPSLAGDPPNLELTPEQPRAYLQTMFDLIYLAFRTDSTRVATYQIGRENGVGQSDYLSRAVGFNLAQVDVLAVSSVLVIVIGIRFDDSKILRRRTIRPLSSIDRPIAADAGSRDGG